jgi:DNA-binding HxlR family transcriptional regulator
MKSYDQFCPIAKAAEIFCERWTALILRDLWKGSSRFSELHRGVPLMSASMLSKRLAQLEKEGIIVRRRSKSARTWTYHLTQAGREFIPIVKALGIWGQHWGRRKLDDGEIDLGLMIWEMERGVRPKFFGDQRTVVHLELSDQPSGKREWWFINEEGRLDLCLEDPGFEVDLYLTTTLPDMIHIWRGDMSLTQALNSGRFEALGPTRLKRALRSWLKLSPFSPYGTKSQAERSAA